MNAIKVRAVAPEEKPVAGDEDLLGALASELECDATAEAVAARITELVAFEEKVREAADTEDLDEIVERLEEADDEHLNTIALEAIQAALDISDVDVKVIAQHSIPEFAAKQRLQQAHGSLLPDSPLRVLVQTTIKSLAARAQ